MTKIAYVADLSITSSHVQHCTYIYVYAIVDSKMVIDPTKPLWHGTSLRHHSSDISDDESDDSDEKGSEDVCNGCFFYKHYDWVNGFRGPTSTCVTLYFKDFRSEDPEKFLANRKEHPEDVYYDVTQTFLGQ